MKTKNSTIAGICLFGSLFVFLSGLVYFTVIGMKTITDTILNIWLIFIMILFTIGFVYTYKGDYMKIKSAIKEFLFKYFDAGKKGYLTATECFLALLALFGAVIGIALIVVCAGILFIVIFPISLILIMFCLIIYILDKIKTPIIKRG